MVLGFTPLTFNLHLSPGDFKTADYPPFSIIPLQLRPFTHQKQDQQTGPYANAHLTFPISV